MLGFKPCTLKMENEFNIPLDIGNCVALDGMDVSMGLVRMVEVAEQEEVGSVTVEPFAGIAFVLKELPASCPLLPVALSSGG